MSDTVSREQHVYLAKLAEQAERYEGTPLSLSPSLFSLRATLNCHLSVMPSRGGFTRSTWDGRSAEKKHALVKDYSLFTGNNKDRWTVANWLIIRRPSRKQKKKPIQVEMMSLILHLMTTSPSYWEKRSNRTLVKETATHLLSFFLLYSHNRDGREHEARCFRGL